MLKTKLADWRSKKLVLSTAFFYMVIILLIVGGVVATIYTVNATKKQIESSLIGRIGSIAAFADYEYFEGLSGDKTDLKKRDYIDLKDHLLKSGAANPDTRFIYLMGKDDRGVFFYADSVPTSDPGYSAPGDRYDEASQGIKDAFKGGDNFVEGPYRDSFGNWVSGIAPIKDQQGRVVAVAGIDVAYSNYRREVIKNASIPIGASFTLLILAIIGLKIQKGQIAAGNRKAELVSVASHDLRSPLSGVEWAAKMMAEENKDPEQKELAESIASTVIELRNTVNTVLELAVEEKGIDTGLNKELVSLRPLLNEAANTFSLSARQKGVSIVVDLSVTTDITIHVDKEKFKRAIVNLVNNAVKYTKDNTQITIGYKMTNNMHTISVKDEGIGIPKADQSKVLLGFHRAANAIKSGIEGTGLGMQLTKKIIEAHQGNISFESTENAGTTFFVAIPAKLEG